MAPKVSNVGGGSATGLAKDFTDWLDKALNTGSFGPAGTGNPTGQTTGISGVLNDILAGGAGKLGGSLNSLIENKQQMDIGDLRARFGASGGMAFGTPAAYAEAQLRAKQGPEAATAIGGLQLSALQPILQLIAQLSGKGIPQAESVVSTNPWLSGFEALAGGVGGALSGSNFGNAR